MYKKVIPDTYEQLLYIYQALTESGYRFRSLISKPEATLAKKAQEEEALRGTRSQMRTHSPLADTGQCDNATVLNVF